MSIEKKKRDYENLDQEYKSKIKELLGEKVRLIEEVEQKSKLLNEKNE